MPEYSIEFVDSLGERTGVFPQDVLLGILRILDKIDPDLVSEGVYPFRAEDAATLAGDTAYVLEKFAEKGIE